MSNGRLTKAEQAAIADAPEEVRAFVSETRGDFVARASAYAKVAAAARAERSAIMEVRLLELAKATRNPSQELRRVANELDAVKGENRSLREELTATKALPAAAVHSGRD